MTWIRSGGAIAALLLLITPAAADSLFFKDGRYYEVPRLVEQDKVLEAMFQYGTVTISKDLVQDWSIEAAGGQIQAKNDEEKAKLEKGLVPFEGKWVPKARRDQILTQRNEEAQAELDEYRKHQNWRDRYQESTKHFDFEYTVPQNVGQEYMDMFEVYWNVFAKDWKISQPRGEKLKVCFYNNRDDFTRIGNVSRGVLGYFRFVEPLELNFFYERRDRRLTLDVLFHELNHYLFHLYTRNNFQLSSWLEEGMAEYYGASQWDPTTSKMTVGHIQEGRLVRLIDVMDGGEMQDLRGLMSLPSIDATQYAWSWTLCHMLMEDPKTKGRFKKYIDKMARGRAEREPNPRNMNFMWVKRDYAIDQFQKMLGIKDLDAFEQQWYDYIRSLEVQSARGYHKAALFCQKYDRPVRAGVYFKKAIEMYTDNPSTYEEYGKLLISEEKYRDGIEILSKGAGLDPMNPYFYKEQGRALRKLGGSDNLEKGKNLQLLAYEMDRNDPGILFGLDSEVLEAAVALEGN